MGTNAKNLLVFNISRRLLKSLVFGKLGKSFKIGSAESCLRKGQANCKLIYTAEVGVTVTNIKGILITSVVYMLEHEFKQS